MLALDADSTTITTTSGKDGATETWKETFGHHPLGTWFANKGAVPVMLLRPGNAASNTAADRVRVLKQALWTIPAGRHGGKVLIRIDGARASHELIEQMGRWSNGRRTVRFVCGWTITVIDEQAIRKLSKTALPTVDQDGNGQDGADEAQLTGLATCLDGWPNGVWLIVRRTRPSRRHAKKLTAYERQTDWLYQITVTPTSPPQ